MDGATVNDNLAKAIAGISILIFYILALEGKIP